MQWQRQDFTSGAKPSPSVPHLHSPSLSLPPFPFPVLSGEQERGKNPLSQSSRAVAGRSNAEHDHCLKTFTRNLFSLVITRDIFTY